jgi:hypothetical protein
METADDVVNAFCNAWMAKDWAKMLTVCQKSWAARYDAATLKGWFESRPIQSFKIVGFEGFRPVMGDVVVMLDGKTVVRARLIKENPPTFGGMQNNPSEDGEWGVNPISVLREQTVKEG